MSETKYVLDTSALIELAIESDKGLRVFSMLKDAKVLVPTIVIAELRSKLGRTGIESGIIIDHIRKSAKLLDLTFEVADEAGMKHVELRKTIKNISLADCIIITYGEVEKAKIITTDHHMEGFGGIIL